jgi:urease accessory protein
MALVRVDAILGRATEDGWPERLRDAQVDVLRLGQAEAQKSRLRTCTEGGVEVAVSLDRGTQLSDGDVLLWDETRRTALVARIDLTDVLVIDLAALLSGPRDAALATCVKLGHALGNQHWTAVVNGTRVYVPLTVARAVMDSVIRTHDFKDVTFGFVHGSDIVRLLAPRETRLLFGTVPSGGGRPPEPPTRRLPAAR